MAPRVCDCFYCARWELIARKAGGGFLGRQRDDGGVAQDEFFAAEVISGIEGP